MEPAIFALAMSRAKRPMPATKQACLFTVEMVYWVSSMRAIMNHILGEVTALKLEFKSQRAPHEDTVKPITAVFIDYESLYLSFMNKYATAPDLGPIRCIA